MRLKSHTVIARKYAGSVACLSPTVWMSAMPRGGTRSPAPLSSLQLASFARPNLLGYDALRVDFEAAKAYWRVLRYPVSRRPLIFENTRQN